MTQIKPPPARARLWHSALLGGALLALCACAMPGDDTADAPGRPHESVERKTIIASLNRLPEFGHVLRGLRASTLGSTLDQPGNFTLLAPRDAAFAELPPAQRDALFLPAAAPQFAASLRGQIIPRMLRAEELRTLISAGGGSASLTTLAGTTLRFSEAGQMLIVTAPGGATATMGTQEISSGNGTIFVLDHWIG